MVEIFTLSCSQMDLSQRPGSASSLYKFRLFHSRCLQAGVRQSQWFAFS